MSWGLALGSVPHAGAGHPYSPSCREGEFFSETSGTAQSPLCEEFCLFLLYEEPKR